MSYPHVLSGLTAREAITDTLYRAVNGLDTANSALFNSALTDDSVFDLNGTVSSGREEIRTGIYEKVAHLDTTHFITNVRVNVKDGADVAKMTATALAQHFRPKQGNVPGATHFLGGSQYDIDLVKDAADGLWKAKHWKMTITWSEGDYAVFQG